MCHGSATSNQEVAGKAEYELITRDSKMPVYGDCWKRALDDLDRGCKSLTDDKQSRMALAFANCFLAMSGQPTYPCRSEEAIADCLKSVDSRAFASFSNFFTHTHNMCQFLQSQVWHETTQETIGTLSESSAKVARSIANWSQMQETILENQAATLDYQKQIAADGSALSQALESSRENAKQLMEEFRTSTDEQRALIFSIFDRVGKLQSLVVSEVSWIYSVLFYAGTLVLVHVMTATRRTADARFPLLMLFTLNALVERLICNLSLGEDMSLFPESGLESVPETINFRIWLCRKASLASAVLFLAYSVWSYQDYNVLNNAILRDIQAQNMELRTALHLMQGYAKGGETTVDTADSSRPTTPAAAAAVMAAASVAVNSSLLSDDDSDADSDTTTLSYSSTMTDRTWMVPIDQQHEDLSISDRELDSSDDEDILDEYLEENSSSGGVADMKVMTPTANIVENVTSSNNRVSASGGGGGRGRKGRTRGNTPSSSRGATPEVRSTDVTTTHHGYNLRNRSLLSTLNNSTHILERETTGQFIKAIDNAAKESMMNRKAIIREAKKSKRQA